MSNTGLVSSDDLPFQPLCSVFRRFLKRHGLKFTPERAKILDAVLATEGVFEAEALLDQLRTSGHRVSKATVYRTLKHLLEAGILREVLIDSKQAHYELGFGREPKAYLVCVETHRIVEFNAPQLLELRNRICREHGYEPVGHQFVIYGVSPHGEDEMRGEADSRDAS